MQLCGQSLLNDQLAFYVQALAVYLLTLTPYWALASLDAVSIRYSTQSSFPESECFSNSAD